jgi:predicted transcriptional regulator of viral defense system
VLVRQDILQLLDDLAADERGGITTAEVRERLGISEQSASNLMSRLVKAGFLDRVTRGVFASRPLGRLGTRAASDDIALAVGVAFSREPHRIAFRSALDHHGLLIHPARTVQVAMPRRVKLPRISGRRLQPVHEAQDTIAVGNEDAGHGAFVSCIERALLESAGRPALAGGWMTIASALTSASIDPEKLTELTGRLNADVALRRIGSLAEAQRLDELTESLRSPPPDARVIPLDPRTPAEEPWTDARWRVRWPISQSHLMELVAA